MKKISLLIALIATSAWAQDQEQSDPIPTIAPIHYAITVYGWSPATTARTDFNTVRGVSDLSTGDISRQSLGGGMIQGEAHYKRWGILANMVYAKSTGSASRDFQYNTATTRENGTINYGDTTWTKTYTLAGLYTAYVDKDIYVDTILGVRFLDSTSKVWGTVTTLGRTYSASAYTNIKATAGIAGVKARFRILDSNFFIPVYLDAGTGGAVTLTSQQTIGIGYTYDPVDMALVYSNSYYKMNQSVAESSIMMRGPALSVTVRF